MRNVINHMLFVRILIFAFALAVPYVSAQTIQEVRVAPRTQTRLNESVVRAYISAKVGDALSPEILARDVRTMERSGKFSYVASDIERVANGVAIIYVVELRPNIRRLTVNGAEYINNRKVRDLLELGAGDPVDDAILAAKSKAVKDYYRKKQYPFVDLRWTIETDANTGVADVTIEVDEGQRAKVKKINFTGNDRIPAKTLRKAMQQKTRGIFSWITGRGNLEPDMLEADRILLRRVYTGQGYLDVQIGDPQLIEIDEERIEILIPINEGPEYRLGKAAIDGVTIFNLGDVQAVLTNNHGDVASSDTLQSMAGAIRDYYGSRGYIETDVNFNLEPDTVATTRFGQPFVDVKFSVREGHLAYVRDIRFRGNTKTKDKVLRREISVYPGEIMDEVKLRGSQNRLRNLGYYSSVSVTPEPTRDPKLYDAVFDVEEQNTGKFVVGAGFSSIDNLIGFIELQQGNFDITSWPPEGGGQKLLLRANVGSKRTDFEASLTEPWFLDRKLSLGGSVFQRDARYYSDEYDQRNTGGALTLGIPLAKYTRLNFIYGLELIEIYNVDEEASERIKQEEGDRTKSSLTTEIIFDSRNNVFVPTRGTRAKLSGSVAGGPLAGDTDIYGFDATLSHFTPLWLEHVLNLRLGISGVDSYGDSDRVPLFDRLTLGGPRSLRGFKYRQVGPKDEQGEPVGGGSMWYAIAEYNIPVTDNIRLAAFYDIGMVYEESFDYDFSEFNSDVGIGIRFDIPGFPLRFDYAWPLEADTFNDRNSGLFQFSIGYSL